MTSYCRRKFLELRQIKEDIFEGIEESTRRFARANRVAGNDPFRQDNAQRRQIMTAERTHVVGKCQKTDKPCKTTYGVQLNLKLANAWVKTTKTTHKHE